MGAAGAPGGGTLPPGWAEIGEGCEDLARQKYPHTRLVMFLDGFDKSYPAQRPPHLSPRYHGPGSVVVAAAVATAIAAAVAAPRES